MRKFFRKVKLSKVNQYRLQTINEIIDEYKQDGYILTLRQLYYQLVSRDIVPNKQSEYAKLSKLLKEGRMGGVVDWGAIEDRLRVPKIPWWSEDKSDAIETIINQYRLDRQKGQNVYIEVWVEKDALSGVLSRITEKYHVRLMVNRGYSSASAMYDAYKRFDEQMSEGNGVLILYLGDHDPSGLDMIRDINDRITEMLNADYDIDDIECMFKIEQIGLTMDQILQYDPPPNPTKITDPRAKWYIEKIGETCWEVDALNPRTLNKLVEDNILENIDLEKYNKVLVQEKEDKKDLETIKDNFKK